MSQIKRLRIFAGPNGSGKSTLFETFRQQYNPGIFINSDVIEKEILEKGFLDLQPFGLELKQTDLTIFLEKATAKSLIEKAQEKGHKIKIQIKENVIVDQSKDTHSYEASLITSFIREHLLKSGISFSFETVMSHPSKLNEIEEAQKLGYKVYLYFICLDAPMLNVSRVKNRVQKGGHDVDSDKILSRYTNTLKNLFPALKLVDKAYLFDNSNDMLLIAEKENNVITIDIDEVSFPNWFIENVINLT